MVMKRLVFIVEGDCEIAFVERMLIPYLYANASQHADGRFFNAQKITTNRKLNKKGGNISYAYLKNEVARVIAQGGEVWITTFLDFFRLPVDFPGYDGMGKDITRIEEAVKADIGYGRLLPYIQKYEFETLLFSSIAGFELLLDDKDKIHQVKEIIDSYGNAEDINGGASTAPSKRLRGIFDYNKTADSDLILSETDIDSIRAKCPRFNAWVDRLLEIVS